MRGRGGYIGTNVTPASAGINSAASGVWTVREAETLKRAGTWPTSPAAGASLIISRNIAGTDPVSVTGSGTLASPYGFFPVRNVTYYAIVNVSGTVNINYHQAAPDIGSEFVVNGVTHQVDGYPYGPGQNVVLSAGQYATFLQTNNPFAWQDFKVYLVQS
jgi:hypothetical protein